MPKEKLIIFVKNEEAGKVKTRLAETVGNDKALQIYRKLLAYTFEQAKPLNVAKEVWYSQYIAKNDIWDNGDFRKELQKGSGLGERMSNAFQKSFRAGKQEKAVIIGSDCAELTTEIIQEAFLVLEESDLVIGPAEDGGYYLLGMRKFYPEVFEEIEWSTVSVFDETVKKITELGATFTRLQELNDVDILRDWERVKEKF